MTPADADAFARDWIDAWNRRDVEAVLAHYAEHTRFTSPTAESVVGQPTLDGKPALRAYWNAALARIEALRFTLDHVGWDPARRLLAVVYQSELSGRRVRACELMTFDEAGQVVRGEALYGAKA